MTNMKVFSVLVVEDERLIAKNIKKNVERCGDIFKVVGIAYNGTEAITMISEEIPDIIITDICMPEMDGMGLVKYLSQQHPQVRKIILSGHAEFDYAKEAIQYNVNDYLLKPINTNELKKALFKISNEYQIEKKVIFDANSIEQREPEVIAHQLREYLLKNYRDQIDFNMIAESMGFSLSHITKAFAKYNGISPNRFLKKHRMKIAKKLLSDPSFNVKQVAELVGIADQFYFSKAFKQEYGVSPSQIKK